MFRRRRSRLRSALLSSFLLLTCVGLTHLAFPRSLAQGSTSALTPGPSSRPTLEPTAPSLPNSSPPSQACATTIQALINAAAPGSIVKVPACIYRDSVTISKPLTLDGQNVAEIRGSDIWKDWTQNGNSWVSARRVPPTETDQRCKPGTNRCQWPEQVFLESVPLVQVDSRPASGQFAIDAARRVVLADDPAGRLVEVTTRERWIEGAAEGVTIRGFRMRHAFGVEQGALWNGFGQYQWVVEGNVLSDVHGTVVYLGGQGHHLVKNDISRGGVLGVGLGGGNITIRSNRIHDNNTEGADPSWEAGGLKAARSDSVEVDRNEIDHNDGPAIWCDWDCDDWVISNNRVHHNGINGAILYEVADGGLIHGNVLWENGWGDSDGLVSPAISLANTRNTEVYGNILAWNCDGIAITSMDRDPAYNDVYGNRVHHNLIASETGSTALAWYEGFEGVLFDPASNNRGSANIYWYAESEGADERFWWDGRIRLLTTFNATPGEEGGRYATAADLWAHLISAGAPIAPGER